MNDDLFGNINWEESIDTEEVSNDTTGGEESVVGDITQEDPNKVDNKGSGGKVKIGSLEEELLEVEDTPVETGDENKNGEEVNKTGEKTEKSTPSSEKKTDDSNSSSSLESQPFAELSKKLFDEGYLTQFDDEDFAKALEDNGNDPIAAFGEMVKKTVEDLHEEWVQQYDPKIQDIIRAAQANIPLDQMFQIKQEQLELEKITEDNISEDADLRKKLLIDHRKATTRFSDDRIKKDVQRIIDAGQDEEEALEAFKELKTLNVEKERILKENTIKEKQAFEQQRAQMQENIKKDIFNTKEIIPSIPLTKKEQEEIYKSMTTEVNVDQYGRPLNEVDLFFTKHPVEARKALHYYFKKGLFNVDEKTGVFSPDFSKITNTLKTKVTQELKSNAEKSRMFKSGIPGDVGESGQKTSLGDSLEGWLKKQKSA